MRLLFAMLGCAAAALAAAAPAEAHGLAGKRFFPSTLTVDDPFVADELTLPSFLSIKRPREGDEPATKETQISGEWTKRITRNLGLTFEGEWLSVDPEDKQAHHGFGNLEIGLKYQFFTSMEHEAILSAGLGAEIGGTGRTAVGAESFSVLKPALFFGKGLGDLPEALAYLKPFALTGTVGALLPTRHHTRKITTGEDEVEVEFEGHPDV
ncbi:MAG TPA: hypothetical protein VFN71_08905, partial [Methylomirabilota bacterium]|nr:hypothetical protein [Methylomirabilota bacterium]